MFGWMNKGEKLLLLAMIRDRDTRIKKLEDQVENERLRAEGAINLLLLKTQKAVLTPQNPAKEQADMEKKIDETFDLFEENDNMSRDQEQKILADLQTLRTQ